MAACFSKKHADATKERTAVDPNVHFGKPGVAGTRIPVRDVLELVRDGCSHDEILRDYCPDLPCRRREGVRACVQHATDVAGGNTFATYHPLPRRRR